MKGFCPDSVGSQGCRRKEHHVGAALELALIAWIDPNDVLAEGFSDSNGVFQLEGTTDELTAIEPVLEIYHNCNDGIRGGLRKLRFGLPDQYITAGLNAEKTIDVGVINLELGYKEETRIELEDEYDLDGSTLVE
uniref:Transthyretin domain containing protein n=1 Tax=Haemonchus contortus TaxID=6289 RepID=W6NHF8_HAECO